MKILVVDDEAIKVEKIMTCLTSQAGLDRQTIDVAFTILDARRFLSETVYDLLIIDILLPFRAGESPRSDHTAALLTELRDRATLKSPRHIIGITAYEEGLRALAPIFQQQAWAIVKYEPHSSAWSEQIARSVAWIDRVEKQPETVTFGVDVCILSALDAPEYDAVMRTDWNWEAPEPVDDTTFARRGTFMSGEKVFTAIAAHSPRMGMVPAALMAAKLIATQRPKYLAMAGICAGVKGKANYGDPVISDPCWDWQSGKHVVKDGEKEFEIAPDQISVPERIRSRWDQLKGDREFWSNLKGQWAGAPDTELRARIGPLVSGSAVLADDSIVEAIKRQHRGLVAVEMEAYGIMSAARFAPCPRPTAFICKSVCDFADERKDDRWQTYAAFTSAKAIQEFFERYMHELVDLAG